MSSWQKLTKSLIDIIPRQGNLSLKYLLDCIRPILKFEANDINFVRLRLSYVAIH